MSHPFDSLYDGLEHGKWTYLCSYDNLNDGISADLEVCAMPARFYRLVVRSSRASICLTTGSGERMKNLVQQIGEAISSGMLSIEPVPQSEVAHV